MFQTEEQHKTSKKDHSEMEISGLPDRVQNKCHKDDH